MPPFKLLYLFYRTVYRLFEVLYFSVKIERFALRAAILHECQNYLVGGGGLGGSEKIGPPPPRAVIPDACPLGTFENQDSRH